MDYFTFQSDLPMNEKSVHHNYKQSVIKKYGIEKTDEFIKNNPLFFNSKLNRYQSFPIVKD